MLTRVGDEHNGRFVRETPRRRRRRRRPRHAPIPKRLTALVFLGIRDRDTFPLVFYRDHCADMAIGGDDVDPALHRLGHARCCSRARTCRSRGTRAACARGDALARAAGTRVVLDIDYRPVLWGLTAPGLGEQRYVAVGRRSARSCSGSCRSATWSSAPRKRSTSPAARTDTLHGAAPAARS